MARARGREGGASAVEFALLLPVLVLLLFGIMYGASLFNTQQTVTQAAREGARFGATLPLSAFGDESFPPDNDWFAAVEARTRSVLANDAPLTLGNTPPRVCVVFTEGNTAETRGDCPGGLTDDLDPDTPPRVQVVTGRPAILELGIARVGPIELTATGIARYEGELE